MHYLIQENTFREQHYDNLLKTINKLGLPYNVVKIFPFGIDKIVDINDVPDESYVVDDLPEFEIDRKDVFIFGAVIKGEIDCTGQIFQI